MKEVSKMILADDKSFLFKKYTLLIEDHLTLEIEDMNADVTLAIVDYSNVKDKKDIVHLEISKKSNFWKGIVEAVKACNTVKVVNVYYDTDVVVE